MLKIVIDTNVVVSALIRPQSTPALILSLILQKHCTLCLSDDIFTEYREVLARDKFKALDKAGVTEILSVLKEQALWIAPKPLIAEVVADISDKIFLECAFTAKADFIITGNKKHFPFDKFKTSKIATPREFIDNLPKINFL